ncbi:MAG: hypothetical protein ACR2KT_02120 [Methylocella sp.]
MAAIFGPRVIGKFQWRQTIRTDWHGNLVIGRDFGPGKVLDVIAMVADY